MGIVIVSSAGESINMLSPFVEAGEFVSINTILSFDWIVVYPLLFPTTKISIVFEISAEKETKV